MSLTIHGKFGVSDVSDDDAARIISSRGCQQQVVRVVLVDVCNKSGVSARMSRECYEKNAVVEFRLIKEVQHKMLQQNQSIDKLADKIDCSRMSKVGVIIIFPSLTNRNDINIISTVGCHAGQRNKYT